MENVDSPDRFSIVAGAARGDPTPGDAGAVVEDLEDVEKEGRLGTGALDEGLLAVEGHRTELYERVSRLVALGCCCGGVRGVQDVPAALRAR